jgi:iron complex outermembrane recepter protein
MKRILFLCLPLFIWIINPAVAEEKGEAADKESRSAYQLPEVIVTDTKISQSREKVTQKVEVLYADDLNQQTIYNRNITDLLKYQPGLFVNTLSRNDANWGSVGGLGPKYNVYMLDGLPIDSFADAMSLDPWAFDRVELYKGPASVMYSNYLNQDFSGNETPLAGITNFIMKDKIDRAATRLLLGYGSYNTYQGRFYHQDRRGGFNYFVGANYEQSDYRNYGTPNSWLNMIKDPEYEKSKFYAKGTYMLGRDDQKISLFAHHAQQTGDAGRPNRDYKHSYDTINAAYENQFNDRMNLQVKTGFRNYDRRWAEDNYPTSLALREHDGVQQQIFPTDLALNFRHAGNSVLSAGGNFQVATYKTYAEVGGVRSTGNDATAYDSGIYLQEKYVLDKWVFRAGGRYNHVHHHYSLLSGVAPGLGSQSWDNFLWSTGIRYNALKQMAFYGNVGNSFVAPAAKAVGGTLNASDLGVPGKNGQLPNPDLKPEKGLGSDLGIDLRPVDMLKIGIRGFFNQIDDAIVDNVISSNPSQTQAVNAGKAQSYGVEGVVELYLKEYLQFFVNCTYTETEVKNAIDADQDGADISFVPNYVANIGLILKLPYAITVAPYYQAVGQYYDSTSKSGRKKFGPYDVLNAKLQKVLLKNDYFAIIAALDLNNIADRKFEMPWQFQDTGFNWYGSLEFTF